MKIEPVKGFVDVEDASKRIIIRNIIESVFSLYNFKPVETPLIEYEEFVKGENSNDEAVSDCYKLTDKGKRKLAIRYEFTFQLKRLAKNKKLPYKRYQIGPVLRDEPVSGNRWRQFTQCDVDIVGAGIEDVAEILKIGSEIFEKLKVKASINVNNRKLLNEILDDIKVKDNDKENVIREIDKLDKLSEEEVKNNLSKYGAENVLKIFKKEEKYFEKYENYKDIKELRKICKYYGVKINFVPFLARGLSYYNWIVFEVKGEMKETITAGGSYLVNGNQATGIAFGLERLEMLSKLEVDSKNVLVLSIGQDEDAIGLAGKIRDMGISTELYYKKPGKALDYANSLQIPYVVFVGESEVKNKKFKLKDMKSGKEEVLNEKSLLKELESR